MNAILQKYEAPVLTNEAIEVHLSYLRPAVEGLAQKLDQVSKESVARDEMLAAKIEKTNQDLMERTSKLIERTSTIQGSIDGLKWFIASIALILSGPSIAHNMGWI
jgi:hypothetical protein